MNLLSTIKSCLLFVYWDFRQINYLWYFCDVQSEQIDGKCLGIFSTWIMCISISESSFLGIDWLNISFFIFLLGHWGIWDELIEEKFGKSWENHNKHDIIFGIDEHMIILRLISNLNIWKMQHLWNKIWLLNRDFFSYLLECVAAQKVWETLI